MTDRPTYADHERFDLTVLSLGAGVQSTALCLLAADGTLPKPDAAIFADTGWEPPDIYAHLDRLEREVLTPAGIPLYRVSNGNIRQEAVEPNYPLARLPLFVVDRDKGGKPGRMMRQCTPHYKITPINRQVRKLLGGKSVQRACPLCEGAGERRAPWLIVEAKMRVHLSTSRADKRSQHITNLPTSDCRMCQVAADSVPVERCSGCHGEGTVERVGQPPKGRVALEWVGFSTDEAYRAASARVAYAVLTEPLLDLGMSRQDCLRYLRDNGWGETRKSACIGCPFHDDDMWQALRTARPGEWEAAVEFDREIRHVTATDAAPHKAAFLHAQRVPLDETTLRQPKGEQLDIFEAIAEAEGVLGSTTGGCSPYGCVSDEPYERPDDVDDDHVDDGEAV